MIEGLRIDWWYASLILFYFMFIRPKLCCDWYGPLMVAVLCALLAINVALSALLNAIRDHGFVGTTSRTMMFCIVVLCEV